jgi:nucleoside-diphosphate kinase
MGNKTLGANGEKRAKEIFGTIEPKELGLQLREWMLQFITSTPVVAIVLEGEDAVQKVRKIAGYTDPSKADKGTIRGDMGVDSIAKANGEHRATENLIHASGSVEEAQQEIALWFSKMIYY